MVKIEKPWGKRMVISKQIAHFKTKGLDPLTNLRKEFYPYFKATPKSVPDISCNEVGKRAQCFMTTKDENTA